MKNLIEGLRNSLGTTVADLAFHFGLNRSTLFKAMSGRKPLPLPEYRKYADLHLMVIEAEKSELEIAATEEIVAAQRMKAQRASDIHKLQQEIKRIKLTEKLEKMKKDHAAALHSHRIVHIILETQANLEPAQQSFLKSLITRAEETLEVNSIAKQEEVERELGV